MIQTNHHIDAYCTSGPSPTFRFTGPKDAPVILVLGGISATADLKWWYPIVSSSGAINPQKFRILSCNWLTLPNVSTHDQAKHILKSLDHHHVPALHAAVGCSYGGMVALALGELAPERVANLIAIAAAHRPHPLGTAWRWVQRKIAEDLPQDEGLALARALAMTTYRSARELDARFADRHQELFDWLRHHGAQFTQAFSVADYCALSRAIDRHRVAPPKITAPTTVIGFDSDVLAPPWLLDELVEQLPCGQKIELQSVYGHDAFLKETQQINGVLQPLLGARQGVAA